MGVIISCVLVNGWITYLQNEKVEQSNASEINKQFIKRLPDPLREIGIIIIINLLISLLISGNTSRRSDLVVINLVLALSMILRKQWAAALTFIAMFVCEGALLGGV